MDERERIGKRIAELRKQKGLSQVKLAELAGIDLGHIARIELGRYSNRYRYPCKDRVCTRLQD